MARHLTRTGLTKRIAGVFYRDVLVHRHRFHRGAPLCYSALLTSPDGAQRRALSESFRHHLNEISHVVPHY